MAYKATCLLALAAPALGAVIDSVPVLKNGPTLPNLPLGAPNMPALPIGGLEDFLPIPKPNAGKAGSTPQSTPQAGPPAQAGPATQNNPPPQAGPALQGMSPSQSGSPPQGEPSPQGSTPSEAHGGQDPGLARPDGTPGPSSSPQRNPGDSSSTSGSQSSTPSEIHSGDMQNDPSSSTGTHPGQSMQGGPMRGSDHPPSLNGTPLGNMPGNLGQHDSDHHPGHSANEGSVTCAGGQKTRFEECCVLFPAVEMLQRDLFDGGECNEEAHSALRIAFHDAIGYSIHGGKGGGADGSILAFNTTEEAFPQNAGIDDITARQYPVYLDSGLTPGDFIHLAGAVGTANCPGAPRLEFLYGRPPPVGPAADHTVPDPTDSVTAILDRFEDAGFNPEEVIALLSSHSIAAADIIDATIPGTPFDTTAGVFDGQFFLEVLLKGTMYPGTNGSQPGEALSPIPGEMRLQSDFALARDSRTACLWQDLVDDRRSMMDKFKRAMARLQVLGQDVRRMVDCSDVIPIPEVVTKRTEYPPTFSYKDVEQVCSKPFPTLDTAPGAATSVSPVRDAISQASR